MKKIVQGLRRYYEFLSWYLGAYGESGAIVYFFTIALTILIPIWYSELFTQPLDRGIVVLYALCLISVALNHYRFFFKRK